MYIGKIIDKSSELNSTQRRKFRNFYPNACIKQMNKNKYIHNKNHKC